MNNLFQAHSMADYMLILVVAVHIFIPTAVQAGSIALPTRKPQGGGLPPGEPPNIIEFPEDDKDRVYRPVVIPCKATGTPPLYWTWKKNGVDFPPRAFIPFKADVKKDGSLKIDYLNRMDDGEYQCFVRNAYGETFSRKLKLKVTVIGDFDLPETSPVKEVDVTLGRPVILPCPKHSYSYGQFYSWGSTDLSSSRRVGLSETKHRFVTANGTLVFAWIKDEDVKFVNDQGGLSCSIEGGNTIQRSRKFRFKKVGTEFTGYSPPKFYSKPPSEIKVTEGKLVNLYCAAIGKPTPTIEWLKDGKKIITGENGVLLRYFNRRLVISNPRRSNHGQYTCNATNIKIVDGVKKTIVQVSQVIVRSKPTWKVKPPRREQISLNSNLTLTCEADGFPTPSYTWTLKGNPVIDSKHVKVNGGTLQIINGRKIDAGLYHCTAENVVGNIVSVTWVQISANPPSITEFLKENLNYPSAVVANQADKGFELPCKATGTNPLTLVWKVGTGRRYRNLTIDGTVFKVKQDGTLVGRLLSSKHSNFYQCQVSNKQGTVFSRRIIVGVSELGQFYGKDDTTHHVTVGKPLIVSCPVYRQNFGFEVLWEPLSSPAETMHRYVMEGTLVYSYLSRNDLNEIKSSGGLRCVLKLGNYTVKSSKVIFKEKGTEVVGNTKPRFHIKKRVKRVFEGTKKTVIGCYVTGKPDVTIDWEFNNVKIKDGENSISTSSLPARLVINNVEKSKHAGIYRCIATNSEGSVTSPGIKLEVYVRPKILIKPTTRKTLDEGDNMSLQCKKAPSRLRTIQSWYRNGKPVVESARLKISNEWLNITSVSVKDSGVYQCVLNSGRWGYEATSTTVVVEKPQA